MPTPYFLAQLKEGVQLFNRQDFYEAHEAWELAWIDDVSDDRVFLQGLIQAAAGFYKLQQASLVGAQRLLEQAIKKLTPYPSLHLGVELQNFREALQSWLERVEAQAKSGQKGYEPASLPRLSLRE